MQFLYKKQTNFLVGVALIFIETNITEMGERHLKSS